MSVKKFRNGCALTLAIYFAVALLFFWIAGDRLHYRDDRTDMVASRNHIGEFVQGVELRQPFHTNADTISGITLLTTGYDRANSSHVLVRIEDESGRTLCEEIMSTSHITNDVKQDVVFSSPVATTPDETYSLVLSSPDGTAGDAVTVWYGNTRYSSRNEIVLSLSDEEKLIINGETADGMLCFQLHEREYLLFGEIYWYFVLACAVLLVAFFLYLIWCVKRNRDAAFLRFLSVFSRYGYLMRQLISRDFKTKYKRSVLGILWSFLNPLLTLLVQYIVFSTLFKSDIENFPLYLLTGIVCFNFFSESSGIALHSIVGNASLITKVYVPKYIYPISCILSSAINLLLSLIPLFATMLLTGAPLRPALLLLPFSLFCLLAFCIGVGMLLSTAMVFFRDTQFLWGIVCMLWMYLTPIFYPVSIIPEKLMPLYKCNPLYHIIRFFRIILIDGVSPEPKAYAMCLIASVIPMLFGLFVFKKNQDKFILSL